MYTKTTINECDVIKTDVPLMIRLLEYAREDIKSDTDLHKIAENLISLCDTRQVLAMSDFEDIVTIVPEVETEKTA